MFLFLAPLDLFLGLISLFEQILCIDTKILTHIRNFTHSLPFKMNESKLSATNGGKKKKKEEESNYS
jgi:hypothetical protein